MMVKKSIVFVSNTSFSLYNFRFDLMKELKEMGYEVKNVAPEDSYTEYLKKEFPFHPIVHLDRKGKNLLKELRLLLEFFNLYRQIKPDLVINFTIKPNIYSSLACGILGIPSISVVTGLGYVFVKGGILKKIVSFIYKLSFKRNRFIVVQNPQDLDVIRRLTESSNVISIEGSGVNTEYFSLEICKETNVSENTIFLFVGRFLRDKGLIELVEAGRGLWEERKDFEVWLLGDIDTGNPASLKKEDLNEIKKIDFVKVLPFTKDVRPFICQADCIVLPSYREGIPRTLLEAMAMEKPIITANTPGCREVCEYGINGFLVEPRNPETLKRAMEEFLSLPTQKRIEMGKEGRKLVLENFNEKVVVEKYLKLIDQCLGVKG